MKHKINTLRAEICGNTTIVSFPTISVSEGVLDMLRFKVKFARFYYAQKIGFITITLTELGNLFPMLIGNFKKEENG